MLIPLFTADEMQTVICCHCQGDGKVWAEVADDSGISMPYLQG